MAISTLLLGILILAVPDNTAPVLTRVHHYLQDFFANVGPVIDILWLTDTTNGATCRSSQTAARAPLRCVVAFVAVLCSRVV